METSSSRYICNNNVMLNYSSILSYLVAKFVSWYLGVEKLINIKRVVTLIFELLF